MNVDVPSCSINIYSILLLHIYITYIYIMYIETGDSGIFFGHIHPCSLVVLSDSISGGAINGRSMGTKLDTQQL